MRAEVKALGGADVVYDPVGGAQFDAAFRACKPEARILAIGFASGEVPKIKANHLLVKNLSVLGVYWGGYLAFRPDVVTGSLAKLMDWYAQGRIKPHVSPRAGPVRARTHPGRPSHSQTCDQAQNSAHRRAILVMHAILVMIATPYVR